MASKTHKPKTSKFQKYISGVFTYDRAQHSKELRVRSLIKWVFDYARNVMIVGVIFFLGQATESSFLTIAGYVGCGLLMAYLLSYTEPLMIHPFHPLRDKKVAHLLDLTLFLLFFVPFALGMQFGLIYVVDLIADAYLNR